MTKFLVPNKKNEVGPFSYKFFVPIRVGLNSIRSGLTYFFACVGTFSEFFFFSVPYFGLACDHGNPFLCLEE